MFTSSTHHLLYSIDQKRLKDFTGALNKTVEMEDYISRQKEFFCIQTDLCIKIGQMTPTFMLNTWSKLSTPSGDSASHQKTATSSAVLAHNQKPRIQINEEKRGPILFTQTGG